MFPCLANNQFSNGGLTQPVFAAQGGLTDAALGISGAYLASLLRSQLCAGAAFTARCAALLSAVLHVYRLIAKEQVIGPYARRIVATVKYAHAFWDRAICQFPGDVGRENRMALSTVDASIAVRIFGSGPDPAPVGFFYVSPETIRDWDCPCGYSASTEHDAVTFLAVRLQAVAPIRLSEGIAGLFDATLWAALRGRMGVHQNLPFWCHASGCLQQHGGFCVPSLYQNEQLNTSTLAHYNALGGTL